MKERGDRGPAATLKFLPRAEPRQPKWTMVADEQECSVPLHVENPVLRITNGKYPRLVCLGSRDYFPACPGDQAQVISCLLWWKDGSTRTCKQVRDMDSCAYLCIKYSFFAVASLMRNGASCLLIFFANEVNQSRTISLCTSHYSRVTP